MEKRSLQSKGDNGKPQAKNEILSSLGKQKELEDILNEISQTQER